MMIRLTRKIITNGFRFRSRYSFAEAPKPNTKQQLKKAHDELTKQLEGNEDAYSFEKQKITTPLMLGSGFLVILFGIGLSISQSTKKAEEQKAAKSKSTAVQRPSVPIGGEWTLVSTQGRQVTSKSLKGAYYVIYFGFANCPDICPNFLIRMSKAMKMLRRMPEVRGLKLRVLFVSVDPDRDTPGKLKKFLGFFDQNIIGLSGVTNTDERLVNCMKQFKVFANKIQTGEKEQDYMIDHTAIGYLMDPQNRLAMLIGPNLSGDQIADRICDIAVEQTERELHSHEKK